MQYRSHKFGEHMLGQSMLALYPASSVISSWLFVEKASKEFPRAVVTKTAARETARAGNLIFKTPGPGCIKILKLGEIFCSYSLFSVFSHVLIRRYREKMY